MRVGPYITVSPSAELQEYQNTISGTSVHRSSTSMVAIGSRGMTCYWCSIVRRNHCQVTSRQSQQTIIANKNKKQQKSNAEVSNKPLPLRDAPKIH